ncbi:hypothetical protein B0A55_04592 [Friedmanniomyces simplex]|uniref:Uncharacterized protein n=1 Tax=Friedmanniomyces simplex TaxID=329884 RepID=A0A4U0XQE2_9PEZI|nr:hypothetical protein B0A55_04592 [Friedmanniomyces simplex]
MQRKVKMEEEARRPLPAASSQRNPMMSLNNLMNLDGVSDSATALPAAAAVLPTQAEQPTQRKKIGVGRREIRTCAEGCMQKSAVAPTARNLAASNTRVQVVISTSRNAMADVSGENSAAASLHDSADDESELSELEEDGGEAEDNEEGGEEMVVRPLFPGLASAVETAETSPQSGAGDGLDGEENNGGMDEPEESVGGGPSPE